MHLRDNLSLSEKLDMLSDKLSRADSLVSETEGSRVIVLIVAPKEEAAAVRELKMRFEGRINLLNFGAKLVETAKSYGMDNLEDDFSFLGKSSIGDFSKLLLNGLIESIVESSKANPITAVHRLGILNGFFGLNPLIEGVTGNLANPALFIYPGKRKDHILTFLDGRHTTSVYRALVI